MQPGTPIDRTDTAHRFGAKLTASLGVGVLLLFTLSVLANAKRPSAPTPPSQAEFSSPTRLSFVTPNQLVVSDYRQRTISLLDARTMERLEVIGVNGQPVGVAGNKEILFVGNESRGAVEVYTKAGGTKTKGKPTAGTGYIRQYDLGDGAGSVINPSDIAFDEAARLVFVVDGAAAIVKVFSMDGPLLYTFPDPALGAPALIHPTGIALDPARGQVFVSDFGDLNAFSPKAWIRIYDYNGNYISGFNGKASVEYGFSRPQGLAVDDWSVYVVDAMLGQVLIFDRATLQGLAKVGEVGEEPGQLLLPLDVGLNPKNGDLYVTNNRHRRVKVYASGSW